MAGEGLDQLSGVLLGFKDAGEGLNYRELWQRLLVRKEPTCPLVAIGCVITADPATSNAMRLSYSILMHAYHLCQLTNMLICIPSSTSVCILEHKSWLGA